ncbi:hypothetical protein BC831DRAFT_553566 [Entophlyctis helioformis]|nr:hypothetical protein BC831DRAFT_553566 [Entophlyctis helioformis]
MLGHINTQAIRNAVVLREKKPSAAAIVVADPTATIAELEASTTTTTTKDDNDEIDSKSLLCPFPQCGYWPVYDFCGCIYSRRARDAALVAAADAKAASDVSATTTTQAELPPLPAKPASSKAFFAAIELPAGPIVSHKDARKTRSAKKAAKKAAK